jgi:hypothetical protein
MDQLRDETGKLRKRSRDDHSEWVGRYGMHFGSGTKNTFFKESARDAKYRALIDQWRERVRNSTSEW